MVETNRRAEMNMTKNGIPRDSKPKHVRYGKPFKEVPNPHTHFITLFRVEDYTPVWLVMPFDKNEVDLLIQDGWKVMELWNKKI